jgi:phenylacetic acid degradation operon negative regulatory protein
VNARSALFDLYGDHLLNRGEQAPVAALVRLLAPLGISAPAVRTAVSRMAGQGWLIGVRLPEGAGYRLTPQGTRRLRQAAARIYAHAPPAWDGRWHVVIVPRIGERAKRDRLRSALGYLGYACLDGSTWISPRQSAEIEPMLTTERVLTERFHASYDGDPRDLAARAWDIDGLGVAYQRWLDQASRLADLVVPTADDDGRGQAEGGACPRAKGRGTALTEERGFRDEDRRRLQERPEASGTSTPRAKGRGTALTEERGFRDEDRRRLQERPEASGTSTAPGGEREDELIFVARSELVHGWRKFLFIDPGLPAELLPEGWPGFVAAEFFDAQAARLLPAAARFVDRCLAGPAVGDGGGRQR